MDHQSTYFAWIAELPQLFRTPLFWQLALWQILGFALLVAFFWLVMRLFGALILRLATWVAARMGAKFETTSDLLPPFRLLLGTLLIEWAVPLLELPQRAEKVVHFGLITTLWMAAGWLMVELVDVGFTRLNVYLLENQRPSVRTAIPVFRRVIKALLVAFTLLAIASSLGYDTKALLAGLGIGGLAIAFAAQKTLENLFGGLILVVDGPIAVGDVCRVEGKVATVEDIGLRSTRLRTPERSLITIPNGTLSSGQIESLTARDKLLFHHEFRVHRMASADQLRLLLLSIKEMLDEDELVDPDPARVRLIRIMEGSFMIEVFAYLKTIDWNLFLERQEAMVLQILDLVKAAGTTLATPSQEQLPALAIPRADEQSQEPASDGEKR
jgi:MscS family membrane protein